MMTWLKIRFAAVAILSVSLLGGAGFLAAVKASEPSKPAIYDLSTPKSAFRATNDAMLNSDAVGYAKVHVPESPQADGYVEAQRSLLAAQTELLNSYRTKLDPQNLKPLELFHFGGLPPNADQSAIIAPIDDHTADVVVPLPYVARYRAILRGSEWHIQEGASFASLYASDPAKALDILSQGAKDMAAFYRGITREIIAGTLATADAAGQAAHEGLRTAVAAHASQPNPMPPAVLLIPWTMIRDLRGGNDFGMSVDETVLHQGLPSVCLTSTAANPLSAGSAYLDIKAPYRQLPIADWLGKRIRFSAYIKSEGLSNWGGLFLVAASRTKNQSEAIDFMANRPVSGSTDWRKAEIVVDITPQTSDVNLGLNITGAGKIWMSDPRVEIVSKEVPTTDDGNVQIFSQYAPRYSAELDSSQQREGHATIRIASDNAPPRAWSLYGSHNRHADSYRGHVVRISAWIKSENVAPGARLTINKAQGPLIKGTTDWIRYEVSTTMTPQTRFLDAGLRLDGNGKLWVDDLKIDMADGPATSDTGKRPQ